MSICPWEYWCGHVLMELGTFTLDCSILSFSPLTTGNSHHRQCWDENVAEHFPLQPLLPNAILLQIHLFISDCFQDGIAVPVTAGQWLETRQSLHFPSLSHSFSLVFLGGGDWNWLLLSRTGNKKRVVGNVVSLTVKPALCSVDFWNATIYTNWLTGGGSDSRRISWGGCCREVPHLDSLDAACLLLNTGNQIMNYSRAKTLCPKTQHNTHKSKPDRQVEISRSKMQ